MRKLLSITLLAVGLCLPGYSQTNNPPPGAGVTTLWDTLAGAFDLQNTNSLVNAQELNVTPYAYFDSKTDKVGACLKADWWVTDQQGMTLGYTEFNDRTSFWNVGYQARTVFKGIEVALGSGVAQNQNDSFGDVQLYLQPSVVYKLPFGKSVDLRITGGANLVATERPSPFIGLTLRFSR